MLSNPQPPQLPPTRVICIGSIPISRMMPKWKHYMKAWSFRDEQGSTIGSWTVWAYDVSHLCHNHLAEQFLGYRSSKLNKRMYSICFVNLIQATTHSVKHTIQDRGTIQIFLGSHLKNKDMGDHQLFKNHLLIINSIRGTNLLSHHLSFPMSLPTKENSL